MVGYNIVEKLTDIDIKYFKSLLIFHNITENAFENKNELESEYRAFKLFLESLDDKEIEEFFTKGYITIGGYRLLEDLSIYSVKKNPSKRKEWGGLLSCTDGRGFELPYFDRLLQKYNYLKYKPEIIIKIGKRHLVNPPKREYVKDDMYNITKPYIEWKNEELWKKRRELRLSSQDITITITDIPDNEIEFYYKYEKTIGFGLHYKVKLTKRKGVTKIIINPKTRSSRRNRRRANISIANDYDYRRTTQRRSLFPGSWQLVFFEYCFFKFRDDILNWAEIELITKFCKMTNERLNGKGHKPYFRIFNNPMDIFSPKKIKLLGITEEEMMTIRIAPLLKLFHFAIKLKPPSFTELCEFYDHLIPIKGGKTHGRKNRSNNNESKR